MTVKTFARAYRNYIRSATAGGEQFGFDLELVARIEPLLSLLYRQWWKVALSGFEHLPAAGPALIAGNSGGTIPWPAFMLMYALMSSRSKPRRLSVLADLDWVADRKLRQALAGVGFVARTAENARRLFAAGEVVAIFPEGAAAASKPFAERYRLRPFDWTLFLPAIEEDVPIYPLATLGCDEAVPVFANLEGLARFLRLPAYPVTPFFPWMPFPTNLMSLPVAWRMHLLRPASRPADQDRHGLDEVAQRQAGFVEGEIQAELNRMLRWRWKSQG